MKSTGLNKAVIGSLLTLKSFTVYKRGKESVIELMEEIRDPRHLRNPKGMVLLLSMDWNSMRLGGHTHGIGTISCTQKSTRVSKGSRDMTPQKGQDIVKVYF